MQFYQIFLKNLKISSTFTKFLREIRKSLEIYIIEFLPNIQKVLQFYRFFKKKSGNPLKYYRFFCQTSKKFCNFIGYLKSPKSAKYLIYNVVFTIFFEKIEKCCCIPNFWKVCYPRLFGKFGIRDFLYRHKNLVV